MVKFARVRNVHGEKAGGFTPLSAKLALIKMDSLGMGHKCKFEKFRSRPHKAGLRVLEHNWNTGACAKVDDGGRVFHLSVSFVNFDLVGHRK